MCGYVSPLFIEALWALCNFIIKRGMGVAEFNIGKRIDMLRSERGWSLYKLSIETGISHSSFERWLYKSGSYPTIPKLLMICDAFGMTLLEFFSVCGFKECTEERKELLNKWLLLTPEQRYSITRVVDSYSP